MTNICFSPSTSLFIRSFWRFEEEGWDWAFSNDFLNSELRSAEVRASFYSINAPPPPGQINFLPTRERFAVIRWKISFGGFFLFAFRSPKRFFFFFGKKVPRIKLYTQFEKLITSFLETRKTQCLKIYFHRWLSREPVLSFFDRDKFLRWKVSDLGVNLAENIALIMEPTKSIAYFSTHSSTTFFHFVSRVVSEICQILPDTTWNTRVNI